MPEAAPPLAEWHEFFALLGMAAATLIGAMFVVVSLGIGILTRGKELATGTFLTSTVAHLSIVLAGAGMAMIPGLSWRWFGAVTATAGVAGLAYSIRVFAMFRRHDGTVPSDWLWYAGLPPLGYLALLVVGLLAFCATRFSAGLFAAALSLLLILGIRNAWDMIVFLVARNRGPGGST